MENEIVVIVPIFCKCGFNCILFDIDITMANDVFFAKKRKP